ncbi:MAG: septation protein SpoVG family protein [bacterium]|nr:septation protein SpoVG family protein [bacterium]
MKISDIRVRIVKNETSKIKGSVSLTIDDSIIVHDIKVIESNEGGYFIAMPSRKTPDGSFKDVVHPANQETREMMQKLILEAFEAELNKAE